MGGYRQRPRLGRPFPVLLAVLSLLGAAGVLSGCTVGAPPPPSATYATDVEAPMIHDPVAGDALWVSQHGDDTWRGTRDRPLRTLHAALTRATRGATVVIGGGVWHDHLLLDRVPDLTVRAAPGEHVWFDGSRPLFGFTAGKGEWYLDGYDIRLDSSPTYVRGAPDSTTAGWQFIDPSRPLAADPQQIWRDSDPLVQVAGRADLTPDAFFVDSETRRLYLGFDPTGHEIAAGVLPRGATVASPGVTLHGIGFRRFVPSVPDFGAVTVGAPDSRLIDLVITGSSTTGLSVSAPRSTLERVRVTGSGMLGVHMDRADGSTLRNVTADHNNVQGFNLAPVAGGAKITRTRQLDIEGGAFEDNLGSGLWLDESVVGANIRGTDTLRNTLHGIHVEISTGLLVSQVRSLGNLGDGIRLQNTNDAELWDSTFAGNARAINLVQDARRPLTSTTPGVDDRPGAPETLTWTAGQTQVVNCLLSTGSSRGQALFAVEDFDQRANADDLDVTLRANLYVATGPQAPRWTHVWTRRGADPEVFDTLDDFRARTGQDRDSVEIHRPDAPSVDTASTLIPSGSAETSPPLVSPPPHVAALLTGPRSVGADR